MAVAYAPPFKASWKVRLPEALWFCALVAMSPPIALWSPLTSLRSCTAIASSPPPSAVPPSVTEAPRRIPRVRAPGDDQTPDITAYINDGATPTMRR